MPAFLASSLCERCGDGVRPSFRGIGATEGVHDHGVGETGDVVVGTPMAVLHPALPLVLIGFSFGGFVQTQVASA